MDLAALRDHASSMLSDIVIDLRTPQSGIEQSKKSMGHSDTAVAGADSAAQSHGAERAGSGFTISEMVAEFRALRASVLRLWTAHEGSLTGDDLQDLVRFNESIDQTLAESVTRFATNADESRDLFVAILSHDLRSPLQTVMMVTEHLLSVGETENTVLITKAARSVRRMIGLVGDLLDFTRSRMGAGVSVEREQTDLATVVRHAVDEVEGAHPTRVFVLDVVGDLQARADGARVAQVLSNLLGNAVQHGDSSRAIRVRAVEDAKHVLIGVHNDGPVIAPAAIPGLFSPFKRLQPVTNGSADAHTDSRSAGHHLGLGLYISERIVAAHGGELTVSSSAELGTTFEVRLPK